jgi:hypothetical protein
MTQRQRTDIEQVHQPDEAPASTSSDVVGRSDEESLTASDDTGGLEGEDL